jgi:hypothetical protein
MGHRSTPGTGGDQRVAGKQFGGELNISEITVKAHRGQVMGKMKADSLADLVNMAARLPLARSPGPNSTRPLDHGSKGSNRHL